MGSDIREKIPPDGLRERNKREKLARIMAAARSLFSSQGFDRTTLREVSAEASVGYGTLFLYVKTKEDLLCLVFKRELTPVIDRSFETLPDTDLLTQLLHLYSAVIEHHAENLALSRPFLKEFTFASEPVASEISEFMQGWIARIQQVVDRAKARGEIAPDADCRLVTTCSLRLFLGPLRQWVGGQQSRAWLDRTLADSLELLLKGARVQRDSKPRTSPRKKLGR